jgi:hypothetical protein
MHQLGTTAHWLGTGPEEFLVALADDSVEVGYVYLDFGAVIDFAPDS